MNFDLETCSKRELAEHFVVIKDNMIGFLDKGQIASAAKQMDSWDLVFHELMRRLPDAN